MSAISDNTPVVRRLRTVQELYLEAASSIPDLALCLWVLEADEVSMLEAFVLMEDSPGAVTRDLFLTLVAADAGATNYPQALANELRQQLATAAETLVEQGLPTHLWENQRTVRSFGEFLAYVRSVTGAMTNLRGRVVINLHPGSYTDKSAFITLLEHQLADDLPKDITLMLHCAPEDIVESRLAEREDLGVVTLRPDLNMDDLAHELASAGDPNDPAVRFRTLFLEVSQLGGRGAFDTMLERGEEAVELARQQTGWEHLVATVLAAQGAHLLASKTHRGEAPEFFDRALAAAHLAIQVENPAGRATLLQTLNFRAAGLLHTKDYPAAATAYRDAAALAAEEEADRFHQMEALRLAAWCEDRAGHAETAWQLNLAAIAAAEGLAPDLLRGSALPYVGRELLRLAERLNRHPAATKVRQDLVHLIGADWEALIERTETPVPA